MSPYRKFAAVSIATLGLLGAMPAQPVSAQIRDDGSFGFFDFGAPDPVGVPDRDGCVKACIYDLSPCDPPEFKRADNRCSRRRRR